jgi:lon-related putative ATP-dependent protease
MATQKNLKKTKKTAKKKTPRTLNPEELTWRCDPAQFAFKTTAALPELKEIIGQNRALKSLEFGLGIENPNYNVFVLGEGGTGKYTTVKSAIESKAMNEPVPDDWCYVYNFTEPDSPMALNLPAGRGSEFAEEMATVVATLRRDIPKVFESKDYESHRDEIIEGQQERTRSLFSRLEKVAEKKGFVLKKGASGVSVVPGKEGKPLKQSAINELPKETVEKLNHDLKFVQDKLGDTIREARKSDKEAKERIAELDRDTVQYVVTPLFNELLEKFKDLEDVSAFIVELKADLLRNIEDFRPREEMPFGLAPFGGLQQNHVPAYERYRVNLVVNNSDCAGAPVVYEPNPTYNNLFGRVEYRFQMGMATTDFTMIKAGAAHRANGGYLVVNALDVLRNIFVYDSLKRLIKTSEIRFEDVWEQYRAVSSSAMKPSPIPANVKLVLIGEPMLYYLLYNADREYRKLFKVKADFDNVMELNEKNIEQYALFVAARCAEEGLLPFAPTGVAAVAEYGCRIAANKGKLSARFNDIKNLLIEASHFAKLDKTSSVEAEHVEKAKDEKRERHSKIEEKYREYITDDTLMIDTEGAVVGQINGIAVLNPGDYAFGKPSRVTARTYMGDTGVVNIEREVKLSGKLHNKGLMILKSFIGDRYARTFPLTLAASLCFEQLYDEIDGDSATCAEVYVLLSSLSGVAIDQSLAITGSMNQKGEVQPIGGVNEKVEGFFDICNARGLTGTQGVILPARNVKNLVLRRDVVEAVEAGKFAIYPIEQVDEGLEILTGKRAGERDKNGRFPKGSINQLVESRLHALATKYKAFGRPAVKKKPKPDSNDNDNGNGNDDSKGKK